MNKTATFLSIAAVAAVAGIAFTTMLTTANESGSVERGDVVTSSRWKEPGMMKLHRESFSAVQEAIDVNDFSAFQTAVVDTPLAEQIDTQEKFTTFVEFHTLMKAGDETGAKAIADELGLPQMKIFHKKWFGKGMGCDGEVKAALEANDYAAFQTAVEDESPLAVIDTQAKFDLFVKMHTLQEAGDDTWAQAIAEELGLPARPAHGVFGKNVKFKSRMHDEELIDDPLGLEDEQEETIVKSE